MIRPVLLLAAITFLPPLSATPLTWTLQATFADGGTASGVFTYDADTGTFSNWNVTATGGNTSVFFPFTFTPANSSVGIFSGNSRLTFGSNASFPDSVAGVPENLVLEITLSSSSPLSDAGGVINIVPGVLFTVASAECFDCNPYRQITSGTLTTGSASVLPSITQVSPTPLVGPNSPGLFFSGTFVISGQNLQGGIVTADGPLFLTGTPTVNSAGTVVSQGYSIGCCAPQQGQIFHLTVTTPNGSASITDTIALSAGSGCTYSLSASSATVGAAATTGSVNVTAPTGCPYTASSPSGSFATITSGGSGSGNGTVTYTVQANSGGTRSTILTIAGLPFTINQLSGCVFGLTPSTAPFSAVGGSSSVSVGASSSMCPFTATSNNPSFLIVNGSGIGSGTSTISYTVLPNPSSASRTGTLTVAGQTLTVVQAGTTCSFALAQASQAFTASGGTGTATVEAPPGCPWSAQVSSPFVMITGGASGAGNGTVTYTVQANSATAQRTVNLTIAGLPYTVVQSGSSPLNCTAIAPTAAQVAIEGRTEVVGDLILSCTGLASTLTADISLTLNTNVTNAITAGATDASLLVNGSNPQPGLVSGYNTVDWPAVSLVPAGGGTATVRITNVRADASLLGAPANLQSVPLTGVVSVGAAVTVPVTNASQILAYAAPTLVLQIMTPSTQGTATTIPLQYQEASIAAFHAAGTTPATRLRLVISNLPSNVVVSVPVFPNEGTARAQLFSANPDGSGGSPVPGVAGSYQQLLVSGGVATATWVVLSADPASFQTDTFPLMLQNSTGANLNSILITASLGPVSTVSVASATAPVPRFRDFSVSQPLVNLRSNASVQGAGSVSNAISGGTASLSPRLSAGAVASNASFTGQVTNDNQDPNAAATDTVIRGKVTGGGNITDCEPAPACTFSGNEATMIVGTLPPMQTATMTIHVAAQASGGIGASVLVQCDFSVESDQANADLSASHASSGILLTPLTIGPPAVLTPSGTPQSASVGTAFASPLQVTVTDSGGNLLSGITVTFTAPSSGASAVLSSSTAVTNASGVASVTAIANSATGSYSVTATVPLGIASLSASFSLTNTSPCTPSSTNLAQCKAATQSSTLPGTPAAGVVVDGNTDGSFFDGSVTATNLETYPWWQVDLGASANIASIVVWNRTDCCGSRLGDYWVYVSDTPFFLSDTPITLQNRAGVFSSHQTTAPNPSTTIAVGIQGRYVRVQLNTSNYLSLAEVQVFSGQPGQDLALGKPATQSTTLPGTPAAGVAVDGSTDGSFLDGSVTATNLETNPWWQVDLGASATIGSVVVWNRTDCCASRLSDYWVFVSNTPFLTTDTPATLQNRAGTFSSHQTNAPNPSTTISVTAGTQGRYVRVQLSSPNYLSLAEVQVMGSSGGPTDLAQNQPATQSSTLLGTPAAAVAVDGNTDGSFGDGSVTATNLDSNAWWQVDLGASATIGSVAIWNRTDCCGSRLNDYWVFVSDTPFLATDTPATLQVRAGTFSSHQTAAPNPSAVITTLTLPPCTAPVCPDFRLTPQGRYVRVQLTGANYLSLAEVQVFGVPGTNPTPVATESSTLPGTPPASAAIDGNTDGNFNDGSVTATNFDTNAWWQVDLGASTTVNSVTVWNRTDCCNSRLGDYWVFVSNTPFVATDTPVTLQFRAGTYSSHQTTVPSPSAIIPFGGVQGRYVRVQLTGTNYLSLAEVQVQSTSLASALH